MEGSSLTHGCVTKSTCNLRLSVKNVPKNVPKHVPKFGNVPKLVPKLKNVPKKVYMHLSSLLLLRFLLCAGATRSLGANNLQCQRQHGLRCSLRGRGPAPPPLRPTTRARNVATGCGEAQGVDCLLQRVGLLVRLQLGDALSNASSTCAPYRHFAVMETDIKQG
jgi:hypothetical protein